MTRTGEPREWREWEDALLTEMCAAGAPLWKIAQKLHVATTTASMRARVLGLRDAAVPIAGVERWNCGHCGTRSDAALDFGCSKCWPLRRAVA